MLRAGFSSHQKCPQLIHRERTNWEAATSFLRLSREGWGLPTNFFGKCFQFLPLGFEEIILLPLACGIVGSRG